MQDTVEVTGTFKFNRAQWNDNKNFQKAFKQAMSDAINGVFEMMEEEMEPEEMFVAVDGRPVGM